MTLLSEATDEELTAEAQSRIDRGDRSPNVYMSRQQSDDRAKLDTIRSAIVSARKADPSNSLAISLGIMCDSLDSVYGNPLPADRVFAINTTFYGKEPMQDHRPKGEE